MSRIINGECLEVMDKLIEEGIKVDAVICDPPFGTSACKWDSVIPLGDMWERLHKLVKEDGAICLFGAEPFSSALRMSNIKEYKYDWKWEKPNAANFLNFNYQPAKVHEDIMVFGRKAVSYSKKGNMIYNPQFEEGKPYTCKSGKQKTVNANSSVRSEIQSVVTNNDGKRYPRSIIRFNKDKDKFHPTQKPVALMEYLIKTYTNEGDTVLDFTCGSGSTGVACVNTNRNFIGIELDKKYYDIAVQRCKEAKGERNE